MANGPVGKQRSVLGIIGLSIITVGIYGIVYQFKTFNEMKAHSGDGIGGGLALVFAFLLTGIPNIFLMPSEAGKMYTSEGATAPVSGKTGFWVLLPLLGGIIWLVKTQGAINHHWQSHAGAATPA